MLTPQKYTTSIRYLMITTQLIQPHLDTGATPLVSGGPVSQAARLTALDALRGFACLGILLMNIVMFGMHDAFYDNPSAVGTATGANLWVWMVMHVFAEGKMRALFSLVFGASMVLLTSRMEGRADAADIYYRRLLWLFAFGLVHGYLLWHGEILYPYAICGLFLYPFRKLPARKLILIGMAFSIGNSTCALVGSSIKENERAEAIAAIEKANAGTQLSSEEKEAKETWEEFLKERHPTPEDIQKNTEGWRGTPWSVIKTRGAFLYNYHSHPVYHYWNLDLWGMMFLGMGLFKLGVISAELSVRAYGLMAAAGMLVGLVVNGYTGWQTIQAMFDPVMQIRTFAVYDLGRFSTAMGWLGLIMILSKTSTFDFLTRRLAAVGQTALSCYIAQSVICTFLFTGYGFGLYGQLERYQLYYVVIGVWLFLLVISPIWLRHFRFGPLEWCWRSLTYWKRQPFRRTS